MRCEIRGGNVMLTKLLYVLIGESVLEAMGDLNMSDKLRLRAEAILDGVTGVVGVPSIYGRDRYPRRYGRSDVERSWTFVGKYMNIAMREFEAESAIAPSSRETESES